MTAQPATTVAIGIGAGASIAPTAALASTPKSDCDAPSSDDAPPARAPKGSMATAEAFEAMRPMLPMNQKSGTNTPAKPPRPVAAQKRSVAAAQKSEPTPQPSTR